MVGVWVCWCREVVLHWTYYLYYTSVIELSVLGLVSIEKGEVRGWVTVEELLLLEILVPVN